MAELVSGAHAFLASFLSAPKTELHLHLEGAARPATLVTLSRRFPAPIFPDLESVRARQRNLASTELFLALYGDVCRLLRTPADYALLARDLTRRLRRENIRHAEVYVSPAVVERIGLDWYDVAEALENVFAEHESRGGGRVLVLRAVGFGLGGDEAAIPARAFAEIYGTARRLGLAPLVHAGEWAGADSVADAVKHLAPVRIAHGIRALEDPALVRLLARRRIALDVCPISNKRTGALTPGRMQPARALLAAGVAVTISTDDPGFFGTTLAGEYRFLARHGATARELRAFARFSRQAALRTRS